MRTVTVWLSLSFLPLAAADLRGTRKPDAMDRFSESAGDGIHELNGVALRTAEALSIGLQALKCGDPGALLIERNGRTQYVSFKLE